MRYLLKKEFNGTCRWCGNPDIPPPRRTFCSKSCVHEYRLRSSGNYLRQCVYNRDKGICSDCGQDTKIIAKNIKSSICPCVTTKTHFKSKKVKDVNHVQKCIDIRNEQNIGLKRKVWRSKNGGGLWDADHIIRVEHGGGICGLENLRTLCIRCHKKIS